MLPRAEIAHWLFAAGFLFFGLVLLAEAIVGPDVFRSRRVARLPLAVARALLAGVWLWVIAIFSTFSTLHLVAHSIWAQAATAAGAVELARVRGRLHSSYWSLVTAGALFVSGASFLVHEQNGWLFARSAFLHHLIGWTLVVASVFPLGAALPPAPRGVVVRVRADLRRDGGDAVRRPRRRVDLRAPLRSRGRQAVRRRPSSPPSLAVALVVPARRVGPRDDEGVAPRGAGPGRDAADRGHAPLRPVRRGAARRDRRARAGRAQALRAPSRSRTADTVMRAPVAGLVRGQAYTVRWRVVSADGHVGTGVFTFGVAVDAAAADGGGRGVRR